MGVKSEKVMSMTKMMGAACSLLMVEMLQLPMDS